MERVVVGVESPAPVVCQDFFPESFRADGNNPGVETHGHAPPVVIDAWPGGIAPT
jgi:hypothetical protein